MSNLIDRYRDEVYEAVRTVPGNRVMEAAHVLLEAHRQQATVFVLCPPEDGEAVGHVVNELKQGIGAGPFQFRLVRLYGAPSEIIAWQNDWPYENTYSEQMRGEIRRGDVVIAVSRRGQSLAMVRALQVAKRSGARTIAIVGFDGGDIKDLADVCLHVRCHRLEQVEDVQMMLAHMLCLSLRQLLAAGRPTERDRGFQAEE